LFDAFDGKAYDESSSAALIVAEAVLSKLESSTVTSKVVSRISAIAKSLSTAQRELVLASDPDDIDGYEGCGVELHGQQYQTARALQKRGIGRYTHGSCYVDMYWNTNHGLLVRDYIRMHMTPPPKDYDALSKLELEQS
jgi:Ni/Co efflux regulator RcnB